MTPEVMKMLAVGMAVGLGMLGPALALGLIGYSALQGIARNPEARGPIFTNMILVAGLAVAIGIYVLIIGIVLALIVK
jgi:F-type H+-transporting ATPase subunit c